MKHIDTLLPDIKLRFNIEHPELEDCYALGYESALADVSEEKNPFHPGTLESEQWIEGWWAGFYGEEPLFELTGVTSQAKEVVSAAANDDAFLDHKAIFFTKLIEISGFILATAILGYQVLDLVA